MTSSLLASLLILLSALACQAQTAVSQPAALDLLIIADTTDHGSTAQSAQTASLEQTAGLPGGTLQRLIVPAPGPPVRAQALAATPAAAAANTPGIAAGVQANLPKINGFFQDVSSRLQLPIRQAPTITGGPAGADPFNCTNINNAIQNMAIAPGDVVVVYYSGHGFNYSGWGSDIFDAYKTAGPPPANLQTPYLYCGYFDGDPNMARVAKWVSAKGPRLVIVIADACNSNLYGPGPQPLTTTAALAFRPPVAVDLRYKGLFLDATGTVLLAGAHPNQYSFYTSGGGQFTSQLMGIISGANPALPFSWQQVQSQFYAMNTSYAPQGVAGIYPQTPYAEIYPNLLTP